MRDGLSRRHRTRRAFPPVSLWVGSPHPQRFLYCTQGRTSATIGRQIVTGSYLTPTAKAHLAREAPRSYLKWGISSEFSHSPYCTEIAPMPQSTSESSGIEAPCYPAWPTYRARFRFACKHPLGAQPASQANAHLARKPRLTRKAPYSSWSRALSPSSLVRQPASLRRKAGVLRLLRS